MHLSGLRVVPDPLLELRPGGVVPANDHQVAAENLVRLSILDVELERFRERLNGFADFPLGELAVAQGIPTPRGFRVLVDISSQERLNLLESSRSDVAFKFGDTLGVVRKCLVLRKQLDFFSGEDVAGIEPHCLSIRRGSTLSIAFLFKSHSQEMLGV